MAIFSTLSGTMQKIFRIGKNGATLEYDNGKLSVKDYNNTTLIPLQIADPISGSDATNLSYVEDNYTKTDKLEITISSISTLRTTEPTGTLLNVVNVLGYYDNTKIGGGKFYFDASDTTTPDDGITTIVTTNGKRWKAIFADNKISASRAGLVTGTDATPIWKVFCSLPYHKIIDYSIYVSGVGILADLTNIEAISGAIIYITKSVNDQVTEGNEGSCLEAGNGSIISGLKLYGQNFNGAGVFIGSKTGVIVENCEMKDSYAIGVKNYKSTGTIIKNNHIHSNRHGILSQQSINSIVSSNYVHNISWSSGNNGGGIWTSADINFLVLQNIVFDCADVGIDFEGGNGCKSDNNIVGRCRNGELTYFGTGSAIVNPPMMGKNVHANNFTFRENYALNKDGIAVQNALTDVGSCMVYGTLDVVQDGEISFENNKIYSLSTTGVSLFCFRSRTSAPTANARITFRNNTFISYSGYMGTLLDRQDVTFTGNNLYFQGGTVRTTEIRDSRTLDFSNNTIVIDPSVTTGNNVFTITTAISVVGKLLVSKNRFTGYDGTWIYVDQVNSGRSVIIDDNDFDDDTGYTVIPIAIGAGGIIWKNSRIRLRRPTASSINFAAAGVLYQSSFVCMEGTAWLLLNGKIKSGYRFSLKNDKNDTMYLSAIDAGGAINTGRFPNANCYATFSGNTISFTTNNSDTLTAIVEIKLDSTLI